MNLKKLLPLLALSIVALVFAGSQTAARAQATTVTSNASFPFTETAVTCDNVYVTLTGKMHLLAHVTTDAQGGRHATLQINTEAVKGTDAAGNSYVSSSTNSDTINEAGSDGAQSEHTVTTKFLLNGKGNLPDLFAKVTMHVTINANGEVTAEVTNVVVNCH
jgi:hypothetical protein